MALIKTELLRLLAWASIPPGSTIEGIEDQIKELNVRPDILFPIDEIGRMLQNTNNDKIKSMVDFLMMAFSADSIKMRKPLQTRKKRRTTYHFLLSHTPPSQSWQLQP